MESWSRLLDGVELRPVTAANVVAAERFSDFRKVFEPGLARRSFTLPAAGLQASFAWGRWIAPGDSTTTLRLALGVTDHVELRAPGALRFSLGDADGLERPEFAIEGGLLGIDHDGLRARSEQAGAECVAALQERRRACCCVASGVRAP